MTAHELNKAALEAAKGAYRNFGLKRAIRAYCDEADLVAAQLFYASQDVVVDQLKEIDDLRDERDEARREAEDWKMQTEAVQVDGDAKAETRGKQLAALREALEAAMPYFGARSPEDGRIEAQARKALSDTAEVAAGWQRGGSG